MSEMFGQKKKITKIVFVLVWLQLLAPLMPLFLSFAGER